jgi:hypothetical protein
MQYSIPTNYEEFILAVTVRTLTGRPECIHIILKDTDIPNTVFTDRYMTVTEETFTFYVRLPVTGKNAQLTVFNEKTGNIPKISDPTFEVVSINKQPLKKKTDVVDFTNPAIRSFVNFVTRFCFNAGNLVSGTYVSDDERYRIIYMPTIRDRKNAKELNTPARINKGTGIIECSQRKIIPMTVPMRMAILMHEFSHFYVNDDIDNEVEADLNALLIYLSLGYPRIEAYEAFLGTFEGTPSVQNKERAEIIDKFIREFEEQNMVLNG